MAKVKSIIEQALEVAAKAIGGKAAAATMAESRKVSKSAPVEPFVRKVKYILTKRGRMSSNAKNVIARLEKLQRGL